VVHVLDQFRGGARLKIGFGVAPQHSIQRETVFASLPLERFADHRGDFGAARKRRLQALDLSRPNLILINIVERRNERIKLAHQCQAPRRQVFEFPTTMFGKLANDQRHRPFISFAESAV
jgi:hypothetical protein